MDGQELRETRCGVWRFVTALSCAAAGRLGRTLAGLTALCIAAGFPLPGLGAEPVKEGGWLRTTDEKTGVSVNTLEMTLHPRAEPRPALKHRLLPDDFDLVEGNAAVFYLKAMGFLEQEATRDQLREFLKTSQDKARREGKSDAAPYSWLSMAPQELPLKEVKSYLSLTSFQPQFLREAARRRRFELDRDIRNVDNPIAYLLPEIQSLRELARTQSLRCKTAIAEGRVNDALEILGQEYAMAHHIGHDEFLVSDLVGIACAGIAWHDALYLVQHPDAPNLYWAFASLPDPLVDVRRAMAVERELLYLQVKVLREVNETPRPAAYWRGVLDGLTLQFLRIGMADDISIPWASDDSETGRAVAVAFVAAAYPAAKRYLIQRCGMPSQQVEAYPTVQVVFLAMVRYYEEARDAQFKWMHVPYWQAEAKARGLHLDDLIGMKRDLAGFVAAPAQVLLPAVSAVRTAVARDQQQLAMIQAVEAIRMYGAAHGGKLPATLDDLPVPAPVEPATGKALDYRFLGDHAVLTGHRFPGIQYRLVLRFAKQAK